MRRALAGSLLAASLAALAAGGCSSTTTNAGSPDRPAGTTAPVEAAKSAFCDDTAQLVQTLDAYGKVFSEDKTTIGDVQGAQAAITAGKDEVTSSASQLASAIDAANRSATRSTDPQATTTSVLTSKTADEHLAAINKAEQELVDATKGVNPSTPLAQAAVEVQAAAFGLEQAYVSLFVDAGCLPQDAAAAKAVNAYVVGLQEDLAAAGYPTTVDGIYGPATVTSIKAAQKEAGLPQTGIVDPATEAALTEKLAKNQKQQSLNIAALQGALTATGDYTGPIDGTFTPDLEAAIASYQASQELPETGQLDPATLAALLHLTESGGTPGTTPGSTTA